MHYYILEFHKVLLIFSFRIIYQQNVEIIFRRNVALQTLNIKIANGCAISL